jgi:hypothetical protein
MVLLLMNNVKYYGLVTMVFTYDNQPAKPALAHRSFTNGDPCVGVSRESNHSNGGIGYEVGST